MPDEFEKIAPSYNARADYAPKFFKKLARVLELRPDSRILDICCGQGELAKGFSPYVGEVIAVDRSEAMLNAAHENAPANVIFHKAEIGGDDLLEFGPVDAISVGRALRYLPRVPTVRFFERALPKGAALVVCTAIIRDETPWLNAYNDVRQQYGYRSGTGGFSETEYFANTSFEHIKSVLAKAQVDYNLDSLVENALSFRSSHERIASDIPQFRNDLEMALRPYSNDDGSLQGTVGSGGFVFRRN
jgi:ubiquinone/menaquinone biosynthesis C-methylase UbiE